MAGKADVQHIRVCMLLKASGVLSLRPTLFIIIMKHSDCVKYSTVTSPVIKVSSRELYVSIRVSWLLST